MTTSFNTSREALTAPIAAISGPAADLSFPRVGTVRARVLAHFLDGRPLAQNEALRLRQTNRSGAELYAFKQRDLASNSATFESSIGIGSIAWTACISISEIEIVKAGSSGRKSLKPIYFHAHLLIGESQSKVQVAL